MNVYVKKNVNKKGVTKEWLYVNYRDKNGKRIRKPLKLENTKANMRLAERKIIPALEEKLENNAFIETTIPTLDEYAIVSFQMNKGTRSSTTQYGYEIAYKKHISPRLGHLKIDKIKPSDIKLFQSALLDLGLSPRRIKNVRGVINGILHDALVDELIKKNPVTVTKVVKLDDPEIHPFSMSEISLILENSEGQSRNFFALGFMSGMRSGEMIGLKWSDIDFLKSEINIVRTRKMGVENTPKTKSSIRTIEILDSLMPFLQEQYEITGMYNSYVFLNQDNEPYHDIRRIRDNVWKKTLEICDLNYRPIYQTRHSFATMMLENGEDILWVSHTLGHKDSSITLKVYARYIKSKKRVRATFLNEEFSLKDSKKLIV